MKARKYKNFYIFKLDAVTDCFWKISPSENYEDRLDERFYTLKDAKAAIDKMNE